LARHRQGVSGSQIAWLGVLLVLILFPLVWIVPTVWRTFVRNEERNPEAR
jgi:hypothetical protein